MKIKRIKTEKALKAGSYIRAVINCHGKFWIEYLVLVGKPFNSKSKVMNGGRQIKNRAGARTWLYGQDQWYLTSLSSDLNPRSLNRINAFKTVLIPFSNKAWNYLTAIKDLRDFAAATNGIRSTDKQYENAYWEWECNKQYDEQLTDLFI